MADNDRVRSDVWMSFQKIPEKKNKVKCKTCLKELAYHGATTNLREQEARYSFTRPAEITDRISNMIAQDMRPIQMVEEGFRELLSCLALSQDIPYLVESILAQTYNTSMFWENRN